MLSLINFLNNAFLKFYIFLIGEAFEFVNTKNYLNHYHKNIIIFSGHHLRCHLTMAFKSQDLLRVLMLDQWIVGQRQKVLIVQDMMMSIN